MSVNGLDSNSQVPLKRTQSSTLLTGNTLMSASKLYEVITLRGTVTKCQAQCLSNDTCSFFTFSTVSKTCTLYTTGLTSYNVTGLSAYVIIKTTVEVSYPPFRINAAV